MSSKVIEKAFEEEFGPSSHSIQAPPEQISPSKSDHEAPLLQDESVKSEAKERKKSVKESEEECMLGEVQEYLRIAEFEGEACILEGAVKEWSKVNQ